MSFFGTTGTNPAPKIFIKKLPGQNIALAFSFH